VRQNRNLALRGWERNTIRISLEDDALWSDEFEVEGHEVTS
jgi:hypothetical protein